VLAEACTIIWCRPRPLPFTLTTDNPFGVFLVWFGLGFFDVRSHYVAQAASNSSSSRVDLNQSSRGKAPAWPAPGLSSNPNAAKNIKIKSRQQLSGRVHLLDTLEALSSNPAANLIHFHTEHSKRACSSGPEEHINYKPSVAVFLDGHCPVSGQFPV
jgi:hypothetical protein